MKQVYEATAPANIAFIKYWGKRDRILQWPANDSLSMTLSHCKTSTRAKIIDAPEHKLYFAGQLMDPSSTFAKKIFSHLAYLESELDCHQRLEIKTSNSFPSECGIASSASGLAALSIATTAAWNSADNLDALELAGFSQSRLADLARRGSGSACRSLWGGYVLWQSGENPTAQITSQIHKHDAWPLGDLILLVDQGAKKTPSSSAHLDAWSSPLFAPRVAGLPERLERLRFGLSELRLDLVGPILEAEALEMHAVMMTAQPASHYLTDASCQLISWLRKKRRECKLSAYFTIDAGPNIHVIYEPKDRRKLLELVAQDFPDLGFLDDHCGTGPSLRSYTPTED